MNTQVVGEEEYDEKDEDEAHRHHQQTREEKEELALPYPAAQKTQVPKKKRTDCRP
jgi:hypothetical protein